MLRTVCSIVLISLSVSAVASEPFTIMGGGDAKVPMQPQACVSSKGIINVTFGVGEEVYYCSVDDEKLSAPLVAFRVPNISLGMRRGPRIAHTGTALVITAIGGAQGKGRDGDVLAYRSLDNGKSWLGPVKVNDVDASAREGLHAMTTSENGTLWCVWLDLREKGTQLFAAKSVDHGATWSNNVLVYRSPDGSVCECCHPSIVASGDSLHIVFRNSLKGNRDMYLVSSHDGGATFDNAVRIGRNNWQLNACPMDGGMLAVDKSQKLFTVWRRDRSVFSAEPMRISETLLGVGEQPWVASNDDGFYITWTSKRDGELFLLKPGNTDGEILSSRASFPVIVSTSQPEAMVYIFWEKRSEQVFSIMGQRIR